MSTNPTPAPRGPALEDADGAILRAWLEDEARAQRGLLDLLREKERALLSQDAEGLQRCLTEAAAVIARLDELSERRSQELPRIARRLGLAAGARVAEFVARARQPMRTSLERARGGLRRVLEDIGRQNRRNQLLINGGIELNRTLVHALFAGGEERRTYDRAARKRTAPPERPFLNQEL